MYEFLKVFIIACILLILSYPILPFYSRARRFSTFYSLRYQAPHNKKNLPFLFLTILEFAVLVVTFGLLSDVVRFVGGLPYVRDVLDFIGSRIQFDVIVFVSVLLINFVILYAFVFLKGLLKRLVFDRIWGMRPAKKPRKGESAEGDEADETPDGDDDQSPSFVHSEDEENPEKVPERDENSFSYRVYRFFCRPFFQGEGFRYARPWVIRTVAVLQTFIYIVEAAYFLLFTLFLFAAFFEMPDAVYKLLMKVVPNIFLYPFVSLIFLQEICNTLRSEMETVTVETEDVAEEEKKQIEKKKRALKRLHAELVRKYTDTHKLRYYEVTTAKNVPVYKPTNVIYEKALQFVRTSMMNASGHVVESYMRGVDALLNDNNVYFGASFYSELGEYLISYTYIRLLAGERLVFVVSTREEAENLKKFVGRRLNQLSGFQNQTSWRIRDGQDRLDQADVLIAVPADFSGDNIVENNPVFFENVCNAIFIEADRILNLDSYLCTIIANRLRNATGREICFVFLTTHICQGLVKSIKKFFKTTKDIVECNSADENEDVTFMLWNCETDGIYERNGQRVETPEMLIATAAHDADVDGIRMITSSPLSMEKMVALRNHRVEINEMKKEVPEVNYMICVDDNFNLASAIYAYTRFRGKQASMVHILSKPYLLREYFASRAKEYVNRSAFIKPRVAEHADEQKLLLLDLFCDATRSVEGMKLSEYTERMKCIIKEYSDKPDENAAGEQKTLYQIFKEREFDCEELVGYMLEVLRGKKPHHRGEKEWTGYKSCYRLTSNKEDRGYQLKETNYIAFLFVERVFEELLRCNRRAELWLNGRVIGYLDTFASRLHQQYVPGQSIVYRNCEYEVERIFVPQTEEEENEPARLYLRQENVTFKNCLDTVFLRRYTVAQRKERKDFSGVMHYTRGTLERITVTMYNAKVTGETYGFYSLMSDTQTLDFTRTVQGNPALDEDVVSMIRRNVEHAPVLSVEIKSREDCNDGMRRLLATVLNEYLRTMFPTVYRCVAVVPVLQEPYDPATSFAEDHFQHDVAGLYPYLIGECEQDEHTVRLLIVNDCVEDVGVLDVLYDGAARIVEELLSYVYSYLKWLQEHPGSVGDQKHYIYFGGETLPAVYDLEKTVALLENCARKFMSTGAGDRLMPEDEEDVQEKRCAFCHGLLEEGRYSSFGQNRYICISCEAEAVTDETELARMEKVAKRYLKSKYPAVNFPEDVTFKQDGIYALSPGAVLNEFYYKIDTDTRQVLVEKDDPATTVIVSVLHSLIFFWQFDRKCWNHENYRISGYLTAQMYYEEFAYLRSHGHEGAEAWLREHIDAAIREQLTELEQYLAEHEGATSFDFIEAKMKENMVEDRTGDGEGDTLFDPDRVPRFWKRFLYLDPDAVEDDEDNVNTGEDDDEEDVFGEGDNADGEDTTAEAAEDEDQHMAPPPGSEADDETVDDADPTDDTDPTDDIDPADGEETPRERRKRERLAKKAQREEAKRKKREQKELEKLRRKRQKEDPDGAEDADVLPPEDDTDTGDGDPTDTKSGKKKAKVKKKKPLVRGIKSGEEMIPLEDEENINPHLALYNRIARAAFDFNQGEIELPYRMHIDEVRRIYYYVMYDYPEIFWIKTFNYTHNGDHVVLSMRLLFRYEKPDGSIDVSLIKRYRKEIRESASYFTKGISRKTSPYKALLTIYRRVVLAFDYDHDGLKRQKSGLGPGENVEDELRSLHAALVKHKVVCVGYAVAMQYLLQSVGICCAQIVSETHSWNVVKIGGNVYHLDATWGDQSGEQYRNRVFYDYFCITSGENNRDGATRVPDVKLFGDHTSFTAQKYEYFRYHNAYVTRYDEAKIARILADGILRKEPCIGFRCSSQTLFDTVYARLKNGRKPVLEQEVRKLVAVKNKRLARRISFGSWVSNSKQYTFYFVDCLK